MPKAKILYVSHSPYMYGAESCLVTLVQYLDKDKFEPVVVVPDEGPLKERLAAAGVRTYLYRAQWWARNENRINLEDGDGRTRVKDLVGIIERERPDIVHSNTSVIWDGAVAAKLTGTRHIWHIHEILRGHPSITPLLPLPLLYKSLDYLSEKVVVVAAEVGAELTGLIAAEKLCTIHNGIDEARYSSAPDRSLRLELGLKPDDLVALTVASIRKYKGIDTLVEAASQVRQRGAKVKFVIAGTGPKENLAELKEKADRLGLKEDLFFLGHRTDVPRLLAGADLFVLPSLQEAFPLVVLEAMASGKPVVATDCGGTTEMIAEGRSGFVVPVQAPDILAEKIMEIVSDPEQLGVMGSNALARFNEKYRAKIFARNFEAVYQNVLAMEKQAGPGEQELILLEAVLDAYQNLIDLMRRESDQEGLISEKVSTIELQTRKIADLDQRLASSNDLIQQRDQLLAQRDESIAQLKQWLSARESDVRDHSRWVEEKNRMIAERDRLLSEWSKLNKSYEQRLVQRDAENSQLNERLTAYDQWMQKMAEEFARSDERRFQLENTLQKSSADLADRDRQIHDVMAALSKLEQGRSELESRLQESSLDLADRDRQIHDVTAALASSEQGRSELENRLQQASDQLASASERISHVEAELRQERGQLQELQQHTAEKLAHQDEELRNRDRLLAGLKQELARLSEKTEIEHQKLQSIIDEKEKTIDAVLNSKSWKVTAPLRKALDILREKE